MKCWKCGNELTTGDAPNSAQCRRCDQASISSSPASAGSPDYAYKTIDEYEEIVGYKVSEAFRIGWDLARNTNAHLAGLMANKEAKMNITTEAHGDTSRMCLPDAHTPRDCKHGRALKHPCDCCTIERLERELAEATAKIAAHEAKDRLTAARLRALEAELSEARRQVEALCGVFERNSACAICPLAEHMHCGTATCTDLIRAWSLAEARKGI